MSKNHFITLICLFSVAPLLFGAGRVESSDWESAKASYVAADEALNAVYAEARASLNEAAFAELKQEQHGWLRYRDFYAGEVLKRDMGMPDVSDERLHRTTAYWERMQSLTEQRTRIIRVIAGVTIAEASDWTGEWIDGRGGTLRLLEREDGRLAFELQVVRGPTHHTGSITGFAPINDRLARFDDQRPADDGGPTRLTFARRHRHLELLAINTQLYHGARAYFDGKYYRVAALSEERRKQVLQSARTGVAQW